MLDVRGPELLEALVCRPLLVKPNREELARTVGRDLSDESALWKAMHDLRERGAEWVVVSAGKEPLRIASPVGEHRLVPPAIEVVNPIGCGDCLAAGIAWALDAGREPLDAIRFGLGAAADNLRQLLPARLDAVRIAHLADTVQVL